MQLEVLLIFDTQQIRRPAILDLDSLPDSIKGMPDVITGKILFEQPLDDFLREESRKKQMILPDGTQAIYDLELKEDGAFTARR